MQFPSPVHGLRWSSASLCPAGKQCTRGLGERWLSCAHISRADERQIVTKEERMIYFFPYFFCPSKWSLPKTCCYLAALPQSSTPRRVASGALPSHRDGKLPCIALCPARQWAKHDQCLVGSGMCRSGVFWAVQTTGECIEVGCQQCPFLLGSSAVLPAAFVSAAPAGSRKREEGGRPVRRNNGAGQSRH